MEIAIVTVMAGLEEKARLPRERELKAREIQTSHSSVVAAAAAAAVVMVVMVVLLVVDGYQNE